MYDLNRNTDLIDLPLSVSEEFFARVEWSSDCLVRVKTHMEILGWKVSWGALKQSLVITEKGLTEVFDPWEKFNLNLFDDEGSPLTLPHPMDISNEWNQELREKTHG